jgi:2'-5' RNA ligase
VRLFVALEIPAAVREEARRRVASVQDRLPPARWVDLEKVHLTLVFLGATEDALVPGLGAALARAAAPCRPFSLALAGGGTFPPRRPARVAWIGVQAPAELARLQAAAEDAAAAAVRTFQPEDRPYSPHVTVARCPDAWPRAAADTFAAALAGPVGEPFEAGEVVLFESQLGRGGARYRAVERCPLAGGAA